MAYQSVWYSTELPEEIINILERDLVQKYDAELADSLLYNGVADPQKRNSKNAWVPTTHWSAGFLWHYVCLANRENFLYEIEHIDGESMQYTRYGEGQYYKWHQDGDIANYFKPSCTKTNNFENPQDFIGKQTEKVRKLSFTLLLSNPEDYEGGNFQLMDEADRPYFAPRQKGTLVVFDSRAKHRVQKVTKGVRKSVVGWVVGPRWK